MLQQPLLGPGQFGDVRQQHHRAPGLAAIGGGNDHLNLTVFLVLAVQCHHQIVAGIAQSQGRADEMDVLAILTADESMEGHADKMFTCPTGHLQHLLAGILHSALVVDHQQQRGGITVEVLIAFFVVTQRFHHVEDSPPQLVQLHDDLVDLARVNGGNALEGGMLALQLPHAPHGLAQWVHHIALQLPGKHQQDRQNDGQGDPEQHSSTLVTGGKQRGVGALQFKPANGLLDQ